MTLRVVEQTGRTDVGRQRSANEDSLILSPPFYGVADGMGGAQAGEVASALAIGVFEGEEQSDEAAEAQLTRILKEANRRIYELASSDDAHRGMGTTLTAAKVHGDDVSLGHVGDSRAYRLRDDELEQITRDHSLVAELERTGQISPEAAEHHPQRSIITRALGPEPDVEVDTYSVAGKPGDVFLICSDGLTSMVADSELAAILRSADDLDAAAEALVRAANQSGGRDNITVVLFRLGGAGGEGDDDDAPDPDTEETIAGTLSAADVKAADVKTAAEAKPLRADPGDTVFGAVIPKPASEPAAVGQAPPAAAKRRRAPSAPLLLKLVLGLVLLAGVVGGLYALSRQVYFVATDDGGLVTLYQGIPYELPFGIDLYEQEYASGVPAGAIPTARRRSVLDHSWRSREDAISLLRALERGQLDPGRSD